GTPSQADLTEVVMARRSRAGLRSVTAAAGVTRSGWIVALLHLEGVAAAARRGDVRVVDREPGLEAVDPVDLGAGPVRRAVRVDDDGDAVRIGLAVALLRTPIEPERVLEAGATAALHGQAEHRGLALGLLGLQLLDLRRRALGERDDGERALGG